MHARKPKEKQPPAGALNRNLHRFHQDPEGFGNEPEWRLGMMCTILRNLDPTQTLAVFLTTRAVCLQATGNNQEAARAATAA